MKVYNLEERTIEDAPELGKVGIVESAEKVARQWEIKKRLEHEKLERVDQFDAPKASESAEGEAKPIREAVSLGYDTYLDTAFQTPEKSRCADVLKTPIHRWKRAKPRLGKRGTIVGFSRQSQQRLMKKVSSVARGVPCHFVSLTFPVSVSPSDSKAHLWAFWRRLERSRLFNSQKCKRKGMIWKLEFQKNGNPHFHLMIYGFRFLPHKWIKACWQSVIGSGGRHGAFHAGVDVKFVAGNFNAIRNYVCKYFCKDEGDEPYGEGIGRVWGTRGDLPINDIVEMGMTVRELVWLWRVIARKRKTNIVNMSPTLYSDSPETWFDNVKSILEPHPRTAEMIKLSMQKMSHGDCAELNRQVAERKARIAKRDAEFDKRS